MRTETKLKSSSGDYYAFPAEEVVRGMIHLIGDDPRREGLVETPHRVVTAWFELFSGYTTEPKTVLKTFTDGACDEMVVVNDVEFQSHCEHHMMPFTGVAHVGYLPDGKIVGLSKIPRLLDVFAKRLQVQERLTTQVADALMEHLKPKGCGVVVTASHSCLSCRGARKQTAKMTTSALRGVFKSDPSTRAEFLSLTRR